MEVRSHVGSGRYQLMKEFGSNAGSSIHQLIMFTGHASYWKIWKAVLVCKYQLMKLRSRNRSVR
jgi:hypothetical protein